MPYQQLISSHQNAHVASIRKGSNGESLQIQLYSLKWNSGSFHFLQKKKSCEHMSCTYISKTNIQVAKTLWLLGEDKITDRQALYVFPWEKFLKLKD